MVEMAKLLISRDQRLSITVLLMELPVTTTVNAYAEMLDQISGDRLRFTHLPRGDDILPISFEPKNNPALMLRDFILSQKKHVRDSVVAVARPGRRLAGFVVDMFCTTMTDIAGELGVPTYLYLTSGASFLGFLLYFQSLMDDDDSRKHTVTEFIMNNPVKSAPELAAPCFVNPVPATVFPSGFLGPQPEVTEFMLSTGRGIRKVDGIMVNTFLDLETRGIRSLLSAENIPPVYPVGPILNLNSHRESSPDDEIMRWLDEQSPSSVVFLCFGSMGSFEKVQVREIAQALESGGHRFLWSLRPPPPRRGNDGEMKFRGDDENPEENLPERFLDRTRQVGKVIGWAPQMAVLSHPAVGGFVSHCGWNSVLESLWCGVPVAAWPLYAEQQMNAFQMVVELGLAVEIRIDYRKDPFEDGGDAVTVSSEEIERGIRRLMDGENGIREKVKEMSGKSRAAVIDGGSSYDSLARLIKTIIGET